MTQQTLSNRQLSNLYLRSGDYLVALGFGSIVGSVVGGQSFQYLLTNNSASVGPFSDPANLVLQASAGGMAFEVFAAATISTASSAATTIAALNLTSGVWTGAPYVGSVGKCIEPIGISGSSKQSMSRKRGGISRVRMIDMAVMFPNWYIPSTTFLETGSGGTLTVAAGLEVNGVNQGLFTWSAVASTTAATNTNTALSDLLPCDIRPGDEWFIRPYATWAGSGFVVTTTSGQDHGSGEWSSTAVSGLADQSAGTGPVTGGTTSTSGIYGPILVVATIQQPSVLVISDSRGFGQDDPYSGYSGDRGSICRAIGPYFGYTSLCRGNEGPATFVASHTNRLAIKPYFTHVISGFGVNDITTSDSSVTATFANLKTIAGYYNSTTKFFQLTINPESSSTDLFATVANQTPLAKSPQITALNALIRTIPAEFNGGVLDVAELCEYQGTGKWIVNGTSNYMTADGVHESTAANWLIQSSGAISPLRITR